MNNKISTLLLFDTVEIVKDTIFNLAGNKDSSKIEIILIDNSEQGETDKEIEKLLTTYPKIIYVNAKGKNKSEAYNIGLKHATGDYISFIEQGVTYEQGAIKSVEKVIKKEEAKIVCLKPYYKQENMLQKYKMCPNRDEVDLNFMPLKINLALDSYFIHKNLVKNRKFDKELCFEDAKMKLLLEVLIKYPFYHIVKDKMVYYTIAKENDTSINFMQYNKDWYITSLKDFVVPFLKDIYERNGEVPIYVQEAMLYWIYAKYNCNLNDRNKMTLSKEEAKVFFEYTSNALQYINTNLILKLDKSSLFKMPRWLSYQFVLAKNKTMNLKKNIKIDNEAIYLSDNKNIEYLLKTVEKEWANVLAINYHDKTLEIDFTISLQDFLEGKDVKTFVKYKDKKIEAEQTNCYPLLKAFDLTISKQIPFHVSVKLDEIEKEEKIEFYFIYKDKEYKLNVKFSMPQAHLNDSRFSYWKFNNKYYLCNRKTHLMLERKSAFSGFSKEMQYFFARMFRTKYKAYTLKYFGLRFVYWSIKPFYKNKQVWISFDKLYKAGDNGEYIYRYVKENHPEVKMYYVIKKDSLDYKRLKQEKNSHLLIYGTFKHKLMSLLSTAVLATHANAISYCGFNIKRSKMCVCDLFNPEIICIQHGLTIQNIAQYQNRLKDNTKLYCCASKYEIDNLIGNSLYNYKEEQMKLTGLARYDGLKNNDQKQILITPTWRRYLALPSLKYGESRRHNDNFKNSIYFKIYNSLINDKKLIDTAKKCGYEIIYLLHPCTSSQINDYDRNDSVKLIAATDDMNYEKILTESSLMVTDYSGVQFDFAYMKKPIIYYHPDELPPHYDTVGLDYETMGFGAICKTNEEVVTKLCEYMENDCKTEEKYVQRANNFFEYDDYNNCERIYNEIKKYMDERK